MIIKKVDNINDAIECNKLLTKLVNSENLGHRSGCINNRNKCYDRKY